MYIPDREIDNAHFFLDLIGELDETAIQIVSKHADFESAFEIIDHQRGKYIESMNSNNKRLSEERSRLTNQEIELLEAENKVSQKKIDAFNKDITDRQAFRNPEYFNISDKEFLFYKQFLSVKGLIIDSSIGIGGGEPFKYPRITEMGKRFITFIVGDKFHS